MTGPWPKCTHLLLRLEKNILEITLNRPDKANAFNELMIEELVSTLKIAERMSEVRVILFKGAGNYFCAGGDVKAMEEKTGMFAGDSRELMERYQEGIQRIPLTMEALTKPTVAMVNGAAIGAGCDFAAMCDLRIGHEKTKMGETFCNLALVPGDGGTYFLPRVVGFPKAMEMFFTAKIYNGEECFQMGLLNQLVSSETLEKAAWDLCETIALKAPKAIQMTKKALKKSYLQDLTTSLDLLAAYQGITQRSEDHFRGLAALKQKSQANFTGE